MENDQKFLEVVVSSFVDHPEDVCVTRTVDNMGVLLTLSVHPEDLGRLIGKGGATANALRTIVRALGMRNKSHVSIKILGSN